MGMLKTKENLVLAQKLFDMPITPYPALYEVLVFLITIPKRILISIGFILMCKGHNNILSYLYILYIHLDQNNLTRIHSLIQIIHFYNKSIINHLFLFFDHYFYFY